MRDLLNRDFFKKNIIKNYHYLLLVLVITYYLLQIQDDLSHPLMTSWYDEFIRPYINNCSLFDIPDQRAILKFYQICASQKIFGNPEIFSMLASIGTIILVFLITNRITDTKYAGIIAGLIIAYDKIFVLNSADTSQSGEWVFFFMFSVYLIYRKPLFLGIPYIMSLFSKGIGLLYAPIMFYWIIDKKNTTKNKRLGILSLIIVILVSIIYTLFIGNNIVQTNVPIGFFPEKISLSLMFQNYNYDFLMLVFFIPLSITGLIICIISKQDYSRQVLAFVVYTFTMQFWIPLFSGYGMDDYRMITTTAFVAIGIGMFSKFVHINYNKLRGLISILVIIILVLFTAYVYTLMINSSEPVMKTDNIWFDDTKYFTFERNRTYEKHVTDNCTMILTWYDKLSVTMTCNNNTTQYEIDKAVEITNNEIILIQQGWKYSDFD